MSRSPTLETQKRHPLTETPIPVPNARDWLHSPPHTPPIQLVPAQVQQKPYLKRLFQRSTGLHVLELGAHKRGALSRLDVEELGHPPYRPVHLHRHAWSQLVAGQHTHAMRSETLLNSHLPRQQASGSSRATRPPRVATSADRRYGARAAGATAHRISGSRDKSALHGDEKRQEQQKEHQLNDPQWHGRKGARVGKTGTGRQCEAMKPTGGSPLVGTTGNVSGELDPRGKQAEGHAADQIHSQIQNSVLCTSCRTNSGHDTWQEKKSSATVTSFSSFSAGHQEHSPRWTRHRQAQEEAAATELPSRADCRRLSPHRCAPQASSHRRLSQFSYLPVPYTFGPYPRLLFSPSTLTWTQQRSTTSPSTLKVTSSSLCLVCYRPSHPDSIRPVRGSRSSLTLQLVTLREPRSPRASAALLYATRWRRERSRTQTAIATGPQAAAARP